MPDKIKVLLVEDDPITQNLIKAFLRRSGNFSVLVTGTIKEAKAVLKKNSDIQAIIFDGQLIGENTLGMIKEVSDSDFSGHMIAISANTEPGGMHEQQIRAGCNESCLCKPPLSKLVELMERLTFPRPQA